MRYSAQNDSDMENLMRRAANVVPLWFPGFWEMRLQMQVSIKKQSSQYQRQPKTYCVKTNSDEYQNALEEVVA